MNPKIIPENENIIFEERAAPYDVERMAVNCMLIAVARKNHSGDN
jgi:hypothetical protein